MAPSKLNKNGIVILAIGLGLLYFNTAVKICTGWNMINPLCWAGSLISHTILFWGGIILVIAGILNILNINIVKQILG